ncbi:ABC transporter permease [bacterium]|nr:ABC transporter permease [bacterium]
MQRDSFGEFWQYRELLMFMVWRDLKVRYKQTLLGVAWAVIQPLVSTLIFFLFFGKMAKMPSDGVPYPVFAYLGMVGWTFFSGATSYASNSLVNNSQLLTKVYFPRLVIPTAGVLSLLPDFLIGAVVGVVIMLVYGVPLVWTFLLWPLMLVPLTMVTLGVSLILATLNVRYRDIKYAIPFILQMWMFLTPLIYPTSIIPEKFRFLSLMNPMTGVIDAFRSLALPDRPVNWETLGISVGIGLVILIAGLVHFRRAEREFADVI